MLLELSKSRRGAESYGKDANPRKRSPIPSPLSALPRAARWAGGLDFSMLAEAGELDPADEF
jgi:hypothetical protein